MPIDSVKRLLPGFSGSSLVVIEVGTHQVRAVMLKKAGQGVEISRVHAEPRSEDDPVEDIGRLLNADEGFSGPAILVSDQVKFLASEINVEGADKLPQEKLNAAAMWEIEPYLDFPPEDGLFSCHLLTHVKGIEGTPALVFAADKNGYARISGQLKRHKLDLRRAYCPEAALAWAVSRPAPNHHKVIIDCRTNTLKGVLVSAEGPVMFQDQPLMEGMRADEAAVSSLFYDLTATVGGIEAVVLTGDALDMAWVDNLRAEIADLRVWDFTQAIAESGGEAAADVDFAYASLVGAALQELGLAGAVPLGVTDRVPVTARIATLFRENKRLAPALVAGLLVVCLAGHFAMTRNSIERYQSRIKTLEKEKRKLLRPREEQEQLAKTLASVRHKQAYLETVLAEGNQNLIRLLSTISASLPRDVVLNRVYQKSDGSYWIEGNAFMGKSVYALNQALAATQGCKSTSLERIRRVEQPTDARQKLLPYDFSINANF